jgi:acyl-CoA reductase-like NAD-dependent aldehyde dehydrogenase
LAAIALDDADPIAVATVVRLSEMGMAGQICDALTRVIVPARRADEFADALGSVVAQLKIGDPTDPDTQIGPLVARRQQERVRGYIEEGSGRVRVSSSAAPRCLVASAAGGMSVRRCSPGSTTT